MNSLLRHLLLGERGWSAAEYREWFVRLVAASLLDPGLAPATPPPATVLRHLPGNGRYEALADGHVVGRLVYETGPSTVVLLDTDVEDGHEAAAGALVRRALDDVRAEGTHEVAVVCPYASWWIGRHPEYARLVREPRSPPHQAPDS